MAMPKRYEFERIRVDSKLFATRTTLSDINPHGLVHGDRNNGGGNFQAKFENSMPNPYGIVLREKYYFDCRRKETLTPLILLLWLTQALSRMIRKEASVC